jgi:hypothetical protein
MITKHMRRMLAFLALAVVAGCATAPTGPSVLVLPAPGKPFEVFQNDVMVCRHWASQQIGESPQDTINQNAATGAAVGTLIGAGAGAAIGAATGDVGAGAAIGAGSGLLVGTASGASAGQYYANEAQRRYDHAYLQCMYAKGNQVPGAVPRTRRIQRSVPPPPPPDYEPVPQAPQ